MFSLKGRRRPLPVRLGIFLAGKVALFGDATFRVGVWSPSIGWKKKFMIQHYFLVYLLEMEVVANTCGIR